VSLDRNCRFLTYVLRHHPDAAGVTLDDQGWVDVDVLLEGCRTHGHSLTREQLDEIVATNNKRRFAYSEDGRRIRASQGHSVKVDLGYEATEPPHFLYHGTVNHALPAIRTEGLKRMSRHHVHLSGDESTAKIVGERRGEPVVLIVQAIAMHRAGHTFYRSANGVWLTDHVPPEYIFEP
jgi:putative RNA 2'-phosphotransferase